MSDAGPSLAGRTIGRSAAEVARQVLEDEANAIRTFLEGDTAALDEAVNLIHQSKGPLIVAGIGKSGHIAHKIAATFRSLGKHSAFLHAAEASHGDLGIILPDSVVLVLSNSGETSELSDLLHYCREHGNPMIGLTSSAQSTLAKVCAVTIAYGKVKEACVNGLAPTTSTTISLAIGDALAVATSFLQGTAPEDFRRYHPGGKLGARLLMAGAIMKTGAELPLVEETTGMSEVVVVMSEKSLGTAILMEGRRATGVITDGDMRRSIANLWGASAGDIATRNPIRIRPEFRVTDAIDLMNERGITACLVEDEYGHLVGLLHLHDCLAKRGQ